MCHLVTLARTPSPTPLCDVAFLNFPKKQGFNVQKFAQENVFLFQKQFKTGNNCSKNVT